MQPHSCARAALARERTGCARARPRSCHGHVMFTLPRTSQSCLSLRTMHEIPCFCRPRMRPARALGMPPRARADACLVSESTLGKKL
eukprot:4509651-Prymnesium_polylepis.1